MPHITVKMFPGRSPEKKQELARALRDCVSQVLACDPGHVSVALTDVRPEDWDLVYRQEMADNENLLLPPTYQPGDELKHK